MAPLAIGCTELLQELILTQMNRDINISGSCRMLAEI